MEVDAWTSLDLTLGRSVKVSESFLAVAASLRKGSDAPLCDYEPALFERTLSNAVRCATTLPPASRQSYIAAILVLADLLRQGWHVEADGSTVRVAPPTWTMDDPSAEKARVRRQLQIERDAQLRESASQDFIRSMEKRRLHGDRFVSIFSLMRDGRELAGALKNARSSGGNQEAALREAISPYLQFVRGNATCEHTGLRLVDIWRYFRHTWANAYKSVPGRTMMILVRDGARIHHPVIGIAALSSAAVQITVRDDWIGWSSSVAIAQMRQHPTVKYGRWACEIVDQALSETYVEDLFADDVLTPRELKTPTDDTICRLRKEEVDQRQRHNRFMQAVDHKKAVEAAALNDQYWLQQAKSHLFRSKRAGLLAKLLAARSVIHGFLGNRPTRDTLRRMLDDAAGRRAMASIIRKAKADRVGVAVADITVCGAVPPYGAVLGGKLVAMLLTSPQVIAAYRERYRDTCSVIASSMAGRRIVRSSNLVLLGTTSLYGVGSSQYNRISVPCAEVGGNANEVLSYKELGVTEGYGTFHISRTTATALTRLLEQDGNGRRVHNIFGEGVNPRLRHIRDGLAAIGFPSDLLLRHGSRRLVYGVALARNAAEYLLGLAKRPDYCLPSTEPTKATDRIAAWWMRRWLGRRVLNDGVLEQVAIHTLVHPIRHGARVELPEEYVDQGILF